MKAKKADPLQTPLAELEFSVRTANALEVQGFKTVQDIYNYDARDWSGSRFPGLWGIRHVGARSVKEVAELLAAMGLPPLKHGYRVNARRGAAKAATTPEQPTPVANDRPAPAEEPERKPAYEGWTILELMGHRRLVGYVREVELAGAAFLRIDVPDEAKGTIATQFYSAAAVYCLTPTTEELVRRMAKANQPAPVARWELPAAGQGNDEPPF